MVARSPPKAEAVGSSPTSVAFNDLALRIILFAFLLTLQNRLDGVDMNFLHDLVGHLWSKLPEHPLTGPINMRDQPHYATTSC
jgi:hypothetical protein